MSPLVIPSVFKRRKKSSGITLEKSLFAPFLSPLGLPSYPEEISRLFRLNWKLRKIDCILRQNSSSWCPPPITLSLNQQFSCSGRTTFPPSLCGNPFSGLYQCVRDKTTSHFYFSIPSDDFLSILCPGTAASPLRLTQRPALGGIFLSF